MIEQIENLNVRDTVPLVSPRQLKSEVALTETAGQTVLQSREAVKDVLAGRDPRLMVTVGPCSIHDRKAVIEYASRLKALADDVADRMLLVMRVYFEKPRTTVGWKGLINDPHLNDTFDIATGLRRAREILLEINEIGLPAATEMLEPITPQYIADLVTLASIGARTTESPTHRQMASGLSMPVGYKNGTDGSLQVAIDAMRAAGSPHSFLGIDADGKTCIVNTMGNPWGHLILRGGRSGPNFNAQNIAAAEAALRAVKLPPHLVVDCSHANSNKQYEKQSVAWKDVIRQRCEGNTSITGVMLESNLFPGNQSLNGEISDLKYGVSITDACIGWDETDTLIREAYEQLGSVIEVSTAG